MFCFEGHDKLLGKTVQQKQASQFSIYARSLLLFSQSSHTLYSDYLQAPDGELAN